MRLYGNDIDETTTVLEADLGWTIGWKKEEFIGHDVLRRQKQEGVARKLVGFEVLDRAIARHGHEVYVDNQKAGVVTSGTQTPYLKKTIGMAYVPSDRTADGHRVRDRRPRPARARPGRAAAVLQASAIPDNVITQRSAEPSGPRDTRMYPADFKYTKDHEWVKLVGRRRARRHHRLRAEAAGRRRLPRAARRSAAS